MDTKDVLKFLGSTVDPNFAIDFSEDIAELRIVDGTWTGISMGVEPPSPVSGDIWMESRTGITYTYSGTAWVEINLTRWA